MDFSFFITLIPKLAASLLVILGILIIIEIRNMLKPRKIPTETPDEVKQPETITKVHFPETTPVTEVKQSRAASIRPVHYLAAVPIIVLILFGGVHVISTIQNKESVSPDAIPTPIVPDEKTPPGILISGILIYRENQEGNLEIITQEELKKLSPNTQIVIAVSTSEPVTNAEFLINDELYEADSGTRTPNGELYTLYTLKEGVTDYRIIVSAQ